jgi:hypothetical protein
MKKHTAPLDWNKVSFWGLLRGVGSWLGSRFDKLPDWFQAVSFLTGVAFSVWGALWLLFGVLGGTGFLPPTKMVTAPAGLAWRVGGTVVCWPIKKVVECCVPGLQGGLTDGAKLVKIKGRTCDDQSPNVRYRIIRKTKEEPEYRVYPEMERYEDNSCGKRWQYSGADGPSLILHIYPTTTTYDLEVTGKGPYTSVRVTKLTWDKVELGDILETCDNMEEGTTFNNPEDRSVRYDPGNGNLTEANLEAIHKKMVSMQLDYMNKSDVNSGQCASDKQDAAEYEVRDRATD